MSKTSHDVAIVNARVVTLDEARPSAAAVGVRDGRIRSVGDDRDVLSDAGGDTHVVDARGAAVIPGLVDGHAHLDREGLREVFPSMRGLRTVDDVLRRIDELVAAAADGAWVVTMPLGEPPLYEGDLPYPTREQLDLVSGSTPVFIRPIWGYWRHSLPLTSVLNSAALDRLGADAVRRCEAWADVERDEATGEPTGRIHERTFEPTVEFLLPEGAGRFDADARRDALATSVQVYASHGTTGIYEGHGVADEVADAYRDLARRSGLGMRARLPLSLPWADADADARPRLRTDRVRDVVKDGAGDDELRFVGLSLGSAHESPGVDVRRSVRPYTGWAGFDYASSLEGEDLVHELVECARAVVQVAAMTPDMLHVFERVDAITPIAGLRWILGHINVLTPADIVTIKRLGLSVTTHTNRYLYKEGEAGAETGRQRGGAPVPVRSLLEAGVPVSLGTDNVPTSLFSPLWHVIERQTREGHTVLPEQRIDRLDALRIASNGGAYLTFEENRRGCVKEGWDADLAVLSDDPLAVASSRIPTIEAVVTMTGGRIVHDIT